MTARPPRRTRRRAAPGTSLPRPTGVETGVTADRLRERDTRAAPGSRVQIHHVTTDYSYVRTDLITVAAVTAVTLAFIVGMSFAF